VTTSLWYLLLQLHVQSVSIVTACSQCLLSQHVQSVSIVTTCTVSVYCHNMYSQCLLSQHVQSVSIVTKDIDFDSQIQPSLWKYLRILLVR
jgi:hypothetical protein